MSTDAQLDYDEHNHSEVAFKPWFSNLRQFWYCKCGGKQRDSYRLRAASSVDGPGSLDFCLRFEAVYIMMCSTFIKHGVRGLTDWWDSQSTLQKYCETKNWELCVDCSTLWNSVTQMQSLERLRKIFKLIGCELSTYLGEKLRPVLSLHASIQLQLVLLQPCLRLRSLLQGMIEVDIPVASLVWTA